ncbi:hypothetical protein TNCV_4334121 [Trichonephila clavipes]|nr:hypothetical protein TNCV_4334121 [Trichonephila clavipes]
MDISHQPLLNSRGGSTSPPRHFSLVDPTRNLHTARRLISVLIGSNLTIALSLTLSHSLATQGPPEHLTPLPPAVFEGARCIESDELSQKDEQRGFVQPIKTTDPLTSQTRIPTMNNDAQGHVLCPQPYLL